MSTSRGSYNEMNSPASNTQCWRCRGNTVGQIERPAKDELAGTWCHYIAEKMDQLCISILAELQEHSEDDLIHDCGLPNLHELPNNADKLFDLANEKLHIFPFADVKSCWFRLYTDTSVAIAVKKVPVKNVELQYSAMPTERLDEIVSILDMALIMAGGLGREDMIHGLLKELQDATEYCEERPALKELQNVGECGGERPAKRRRIDDTRQSDDSVDEENCDRTSLTPGEGNRISTASGSRPFATADNQDSILSIKVVSLPSIRHPVQRLQAPSMCEFQKYMNIIAKPIILTGIMGNWSALSSWNTTAYWLKKTFDGKRLVPIEVGRSYTDDDFGQKIVPFKRFLDDYIFDKSKPQQPQGTNVDLQGTKEERATGYLAQHDLLRQIPSLCSAIATPDYCFLDAPLPKHGTPVALKMAKGLKKQTNHPTHLPSEAASQEGHGDMNDQGDDKTPNDIQTKIWFGPAWTISPLHHDPYHNILCQVVGKKYVRLYSPEDSHRLYPRSDMEEAPHTPPSARQLWDGGVVSSEPGIEKRFIDMSNTSEVDVAAMEMSPAEDWDATYPGISAVPYVECVLEAGEALYIPVGWWHYVRSCSVGVSVSFWW